MFLYAKSSRGTAEIWQNANMHFVYVLESETTGKLYVGYTLNPKLRLIKHNSGGNLSTKAGRPWKLIYFEQYLDKNDALGREKFLKSGSGHRYLQKQMHHYFEDSKGKNPRF